MAIENKTDKRLDTIEQELKIMAIQIESLRNEKPSKDPPNARDESDLPNDFPE